MYKEHYYKLMTFENRVWVENDFRGPIFRIFRFQKHAPIWDMWRVKFFFQNFKVQYVISVIWPSPYIITTETQQYILDFYEWYIVESDLIIKSISNSWIILKFQIPTYPTPCTPLYHCTLYHYHPHPPPHMVYPILPFTMAYSSFFL